MGTQAARQMPLRATAEFCDFSLHQIRRTNGSGQGFGVQWPWYEVLIRPRRAVFRDSPGLFVDRLYIDRIPADTDLEILHRVVTWLMQRTDPVRLSINTHPESLTAPEFVDAVIAEQRRVAVLGHSICLELVEFGDCRDRDVLVKNAARLRAEGVLIALDDFGSRLNFFDLCAAGIVDAIKIDTSVISGLHLDRNKRAIVESVHTLAAGLGATVVAEGVETLKELAVLKDIGIDFAQGFYFHKPEISEI